MDIKITLAAARVNAGLTQREVAKRLHIDNNTVSLWERGTRTPNMATLMALSQMYGIPMDNFLLPVESN